MDDNIEILVERHRVTEWRNGFVYKTEFIEDMWISPDENSIDKNIVLINKPSSYTGRTVRVKRQR